MERTNFIMSDSQANKAFSMIADIDGDFSNLVDVETPSELPILPVRNLVLFPGVVSPILIGRESSMRLVRKAEKSGTLIGIVCQKDPDIEEPALEDLFQFGVFAKVVKQLTLPNGAVTAIVQGLGRLLSGNGVHALNYSCPFVPYPLPPIGKVNSGLFTTTDYTIDAAQRISLPSPFSWPVSTANLKRCLLVSYLPIEGSGSQLVLVNLHLEAYDDGAGKIAQTKQLMDFLQGEYEKGNYVIAGGDFNQIFPGSLDVYPNTHPDLWEPGVLDAASLPEGFTYVYDLGTPSCRLLNQPYNPSDTANTQYYVIDGFILSPNVQLEEVETLDLGFENSDHNPVRIQVTLG